MYRSDLCPLVRVQSPIRRSWTLYGTRWQISGWPWLLFGFGILSISEQNFYRICRRFPRFSDLLKEKDLRVFSTDCPDSLADCMLSTRSRVLGKSLLISFGSNTDDIRPVWKMMKKCILPMIRYTSIEHIELWFSTYLIVYGLHRGHVQYVFYLSFIEVRYAYGLGEAVFDHLFHGLPRFHVRTAALDCNAVIVFGDEIVTQPALLILCRYYLFQNFTTENVIQRECDYFPVTG